MNLSTASPSSRAAGGASATTDEIDLGEDTWIELLIGSELAPLVHLLLVPVLALAAILNTNRLSQNGYGNAFYSAGVKSMLKSLHNFVFVSFDPGGLITVDKPPLGLWVQALSAKAFGFGPMSLILPEAIASVISVGVLYWIMSRRLGTVAALIGALSLAVFPSFVAVSRDNNVDAILILLMLLACWAGLAAIERGSLWRLLACAFIVGLAFNTKTLAGLLAVPGIALAYLLCARGSLPRRLTHLLAAGLVMVVICGAWIAFVELTPASERPFVGSSTNNTEIGLTFGYNGLGRVGGQKGGPGRIRNVTQPLQPLFERVAQERAARERRRASTGRGKSSSHSIHAKAPAHAPATPAPATEIEPEHTSTPTLPDGRDLFPVTFGGTTGPLRLFDTALGTQAGWMLAFALFGGLALAVLAGERLRARDRHDPRIAILLVLGGWFAVEFVVLSLSKGIVHPYYTSALGPGAAAMTGAGVTSLAALVRRGSRRGRWGGLLLLALAVAGTVAAQITILSNDHYLHTFYPLLIAGGAVGLVAIILVRRTISIALVATVGLLLVAPAVYAATTWEVPVDGTFPTAGPHAAAGTGGVGGSPASLAINRKLIRYIRTHHPGTRWAVLTEASDTAAPMILLGFKAGAMGGYSGGDPALNGPQLARYVARGEARYVVIGGAYSSRGGNAASLAVQRSCSLVPPRAWENPKAKDLGFLVLFDCAGDEARLASS